MPLRPRQPAPPDSPATVLLASTGVPFRPATVARAAARAGGGTVAVLSIARMHGSSFGMPNPGLMPTRRERAEQVDIVGAAVRSLEDAGLPADGHVVVTRNAGKAIARAAGRRGVRHVVLELGTGGRLRRFVEGDTAAAVRRRLGPAADVSVAGPADAAGGAAGAGQNSVR